MFRGAGRTVLNIGSLCKGMGWHGEVLWDRAESGWSRRRQGADTHPC